MNRPLVIAHRGNSSSAPENTLAAIREAIDLGTDCVEVDVRCTRDGVLVLHHDPAVGRTAGDMGNVSELTLEDLQALDVGSWKDKKYCGESIPTFEEALSEAREKTRIVAEVKVDCAEQLSHIVRRMGVEDGLILAAFRLDTLRKMYRKMPHFDVVWVLTAREWVGYNCAKAIETASEGEIRIIAPPLLALSKPSVCCAHEMGIAVWTYGCDSAEEFDKALALDVDGIVTSHPSELLAMLGGRCAA
jgi:glycerophosphoryl diester phosphodiesterase